MSEAKEGFKQTKTKDIMLGAGAGVGGIGLIWALQNLASLQSYLDSKYVSNVESKQIVRSLVDGIRNNSESIKDLKKETDEEFKEIRKEINSNQIELKGMIKNGFEAIERQIIRYEDLQREEKSALNRRLERLEEKSK